MKYDIDNTWSDFQELLALTADPDEFSIVQQGLTEVKDDDLVFSQEATASSPWAFEYPQWIEEDPKAAWKKYWDTKYKEIDVAQTAADFYILTGIINKAFSIDYEDLSLPTAREVKKAGEFLGFKNDIVDSRVVHLEEYIKSKPENTLTILSTKAETLYTNLVYNVSEAFRNYVHAACGGELRHHQAMHFLSKTHKSSTGNTRRLAWTKWYFIYEKYGNDAILKMKELFLEFPGGAFGGEAWANAANVLHMYETNQLSDDPTANRALFIDRVFNLEHNTGCFLNKLVWVNKRKERQSPYSTSFIKMKDYVLAAHASNPVDLDMLYGFASEEVQSICDEHMDKLAEMGYPIMCKWKGASSGAVGGTTGNISAYSGVGSKQKQQEVVATINWGPEETAPVVAPPSVLTELEKIDSLLGEKNE